MGGVTISKTDAQKNKTIFLENFKKIVAMQSLDAVFKTIALEKNKPFYNTNLPQSEPIEHALVVEKTEILIAELKKLIDELHDQKTLTSSISSLENTLLLYKKNSQGLPRLILVCSSIKILLQK